MFSRINAFSSSFKCCFLYSNVLMAVSKKQYIFFFHSLLFHSNAFFLYSDIPMNVFKKHCSFLWRCSNSIQIFVGFYISLTPLFMLHYLNETLTCQLWRGFLVRSQVASLYHCHKNTSIQQKSSATEFEMSFHIKKRTKHRLSFICMRVGFNNEEVIKNINHRFRSGCVVW